jgi:histidinol-phosphate/aromatic aminotransferase/cobyric acid decarboxylase-like protein/SAM-dependent methyltransferase
MSNSWYSEYFGKDYWALAEQEYSVECADQELAYLVGILRDLASGSRVVDIGCGVGHHSIGLTRAGFDVIGLDVSAWAVGEAKRRGAEAGVNVQWEIADFLASDDWPLGEVDAAVCVQAFGWGSDADQRRFLRKIRRHLATNGVLILNHSDGRSAVRDATRQGSVTIGSVTYSFQHRYDPVNGRSQGSLRVSSQDEVDRVLPYDIRIYSTVELARLVREAGFVIERFDSDFQYDQFGSGDSHSIQLIARPIPTPPAALAVASWRTPTEQRLDLRYAPDEAEWLDPSPSEIWEALLNSESNQGADAVGYYPVDDPYGGVRAAPVVTKYFGCAISHHQVTLGPGVTPLLHDLCDLADGGLILAPQLVHPDVTAWAVARGTEVHFVEEPATLDRLIAEIRAIRPSLVHLDRPKIFDDMLSLDDLYTLGVEAARVGSIVLVDESPATYLGPAGSSVPLIQHLDNLVVLRGLTKAYSWGGLRVGFAFTSNGVSARVRELVSPLQVGELALRAALRLLVAGDIFRPLRARIRAVKPITVDLFSALGLDVMEVHPDIPWLVVHDVGGETSRLLDRLGIRGLPFVPSPAMHGPFPERLLLFSPLSDERMSLLRSHLEGAQRPGDQRAKRAGSNRPSAGQQITQAWWERR